MSRGTIFLIAALCGALAVLLFLPRAKKSGSDASAPASVASATDAATTPPAPQTQAAPTTPASTPPPLITPPSSPRSNVPGVAPLRPPLPATNMVGDVEIKPLPVLINDYLATTNRDTRLYIIMDITETSSAESVKALARLFDAEKDAELKVDLIDSLLSIDGFKDEKLALLTQGVRQGLPVEVRQSAIDGLIDLEDNRAIPLLNGLLNDPDQEIRESAQDALDLVQKPPLQTPITPKARQ